MAVDLRNSLQHSLARALPATVVFEYSTVATLAAFLDGLLFPTEPAAPPQSAIPEAPLENLEDFSGAGIAALLESKLAAIESQETK